MQALLAQMDKLAQSGGGGGGGGGRKGTTSFGGGVYVDPVHLALRCMVTVCDVCALRGFGCRLAMTNVVRSWLMRSRNSRSAIALESLPAPDNTPSRTGKNPTVMAPGGSSLGGGFNVRVGDCVCMRVFVSICVCSCVYVCVRVCVRVCVLVACVHVSVSQWRAVPKWRATSVECGQS